MIALKKVVLRKLMQNRLNLCEFGELYALTLILQFSELEKVEIEGLDRCGWILSEYII